MLQLSGSCPSTFIVYKKQGNTFDIISPTSNCTISSQGELFSSRKCALRAFEQIFGLTKLVERSVPKRSCNQPWWKICLKKKFYTADFPRQQKPLRPPQALALSPGKPSNATGDGWGCACFTLPNYTRPFLPSVCGWNKFSTSDTIAKDWRLPWHVDANNKKLTYIWYSCIQVSWPIDNTYLWLGKVFQTGKDWLFMVPPPSFDVFLPPCWTASQGKPTWRHCIA